MLFKRQSDEFVVSLLQQVKSIFVSEHDKLELSQNLSINNPQIIIDCLEEHHVVHMNIQWISYLSEPIDTVLNNELKDFINLLGLVGVAHLIDQDLEELNQFRVVVVNTEVQTVE